VAPENTTECDARAMVLAAPLEIPRNVAAKADVASDNDVRLSEEALARTARQAVAAWAMAVNGHHDALVLIGPADVLYWLLHPVRKCWQIAPGPVVTRITVWDLDPEESPPELSLSFRFTGAARYDDLQAAAGSRGETEFQGILTLAVSGPDARPWQLKDARISTLDDYYGYVFTSRAETPEEFRRRTRSAAGPVRSGPPRTYRLTTGFAEHDVKFGSSATVDVQRDAPPGREDAAGLIWPAIEAETARALGEGSYRPSINWLDVVELLAEPPA
jgi:hypothetical protein